MTWLTVFAFWWTLINALINNRRSHDTDEIRKRLLTLAGELSRGMSVSNPTATLAKWLTNIEMARLKLIVEPDRTAGLQRARMGVYGFLTGASGLLITAVALSQQNPVPGTVCANAISLLTFATLCCCIIVVIILALVLFFFEGPEALCDLIKPRVK